MRNDEKCCKCGMDIFEIKKVAIPTKKAVGAKIAIDTFYLKMWIYGNVLNQDNSEG